MHPAWTTAKQELEKNVKGLAIMECEYGHQGALPKALQGVQAFPTLQIVQGTRVIAEYDGDRSKPSIVAFGKAAAAAAESPSKRKPISVKGKKATEAVKK